MLFISRRPREKTGTKTPWGWSGQRGGDRNVKEIRNIPRDSSKPGSEQRGRDACLVLFLSLFSRMPPHAHFRVSPLAPSGRQDKGKNNKMNKRKKSPGPSSDFFFRYQSFHLPVSCKTEQTKTTFEFCPRRYVYSSSDSSSSSTVVLAIRSKSRWPLWVMRRPPLSSSVSRTPIFSRACMALRSTEPEASTWWAGRAPRFLVEP